jgi:DNA-binding CsgD family transcriptional regulator
MTLSGQSFLDFLHPVAGTRAHVMLSRVAAGSRVRFADRVVARQPDGSPLSVVLRAIGVPGMVGSTCEIVVIVLPEKNLVPAPDEPGGRTSKSAGGSLVLTDTEASVLAAAATGASTRQLAGRLYLSRQGVDYHIGALLRKFGVPNRTALISRAYALGVLSVGSWPPCVLAQFVRSAA